MALGPGDISVGRLLGQLVLETKDWDQGLDQSEKRLQKFSLDTLSFIGKWAKRFAATAAAAFVAITYKTAKFESAVKRTVSVLGRGYDEIAVAARRMGADTIFSASQAADAMYNLASAGLSVEETIAAAGQSLLLAASTNKTLAFTTDLIATSIKQFGIEAKDTGRIVDVYTKAIHSSRLNAERLKQGMKFAGVAARGMKWDIEETTAALAMFVDLGLEGGMAGRHFQAAMESLAKPTAAARTYLDELGIKLSEVNPYLNSMGDILKTLAESGFDASKSAHLFTRSASADMAALIDKYREGELGLAALDQKLRDSAGTGAKAYRDMTDDITSAFKRVLSAAESVMLELGENWRVEVKDALNQTAEAVLSLVAAIKKASPAIREITEAVAPLLKQLITWSADMARITIPALARAAAKVTHLAQRIGRRLIPYSVQTAGMSEGEAYEHELDTEIQGAQDRVNQTSRDIAQRRDANLGENRANALYQINARNIVILEKKLRLEKNELNNLLSIKLQREAILKGHRAEVDLQETLALLTKDQLTDEKERVELKGTLLERMQASAQARYDAALQADQALTAALYEDRRSMEEKLYEYRDEGVEQLVAKEKELATQMLEYVKKGEIQRLVDYYEQKRNLAKAQLDEENAIRRSQMQLYSQMLGGLMRDFMGGATSIAGSFAATLQSTMGRAMGSRMTGMGGLGWGSGGGGQVMGLSMPSFTDAGGAARAPSIGESLFSRPSMFGSNVLGGGVMGFAMTGDPWGAIGGAIGGPVGAMVADFIHNTLGSNRVTTDQRTAAEEYEQTIERLRSNQTQARDYVNNLLQGINEGTIQASDDRVNELLLMAREIEGYDIPDVNLIMNSTRRGGLRGLAGGRNVEYYIGNQGDVDEALEALEGMYGEFGEMFENVEGTAEFNRQTGSPFVGSGNYVVNNATLNVGTMVTNDNKRMVDEAADMFLDSLLSRGRLTAGVAG